MTTPPLNFQKAIYAGEPQGPDACTYCGRGIAGQYYRVGGHLACTVCAQQAQSLVPPNDHAVFLHALSYGLVAAVLGCLGYALLSIMTGWTIGYAAIGVGYMVGWAMRKAAKNHGGKRYQIAAALLTYAAVAVAFVPIMLHSIHTRPAHTAAVTQSAGADSDAGPGAGPVLQQPTQAPKPTRAVRFTILQIGALLMVGLVSPFLLLFASFFQGALNLFIIFIGVRFAWQTMAVKTVHVDGPFEAVGV